jgi:hypothetical protein
LKNSGMFWDSRRRFWNCFGRILQVVEMDTLRTVHVVENIKYRNKENIKDSQICQVHVPVNKLYMTES